MNRPFAILGFSFLSAGIFATFLSQDFFIFSFSLGLVYFFIILIFKKTRKSLLALVSIFAFLSYLLLYHVNFNSLVRPIEVLSGKSLKITGTLCDFPVKKNGNFCYTVKLDSNNFENHNDFGFSATPNVNIKIFSKKNFNAEAYSKISLRVKTFKYEDLSGFCGLKRNLAKNIHLLSFAEEFDNDVSDLNVQKPETVPINFYFLKIRNQLSKSLKTLLPKKHAAIASSFLLGQKEDLDNSTKTLFGETGIGHLLVVSGLHMSVISKFIVMFGYLLKLNKRKANFLGIFFVLIFMALTGFASSVIRSGIMCIIYMLGTCLHKKPDDLNSLGISVFILTLLNPFIAADVGFLLSVFATLGIILFSKNINQFIVNSLGDFRVFKDQRKECAKFTFQYDNRKIKVVACDENFNEPSKIKLLFVALKNKIDFKKVFGKTSSLVAVSLSANILNLPIIFFVFKKFSFSFILTNVLVSFTVVLIMLASLLAAVFGIFSIIFMAKIFALISGICINYILACTHIVKSIKFTSFEARDLPIVLFFTFASLIFLFSAKIKSNKIVSKLAIAGVCFVVFVYTANYKFYSNLVKLNVINTNQGAILTLTKDDKIALLSCYGEKLYSKDLFQNEDNSVDLVTLCEVSPRTLKFLDKTNLKNASAIFAPATKDSIDIGNVRYFSKNIDVNLWGNVRIESVKKNREIWTKVAINKTSILLCPKKSDLLKAPTSFLESDLVFFCDLPKNLQKSKAQYAVVSCDFDKLKSNAKKVCVLNKTPLFATANADVNVEFLEDNKISF